ncbi:RNA-binding protein MEX3B-like [Styela clava]
MSCSPTMFQELEAPPGSGQEDQRALQIALELSNLGLLGTGDDDSSTSSYDEITKSKKSQNMTECVPVPSSEHVAEIVGRQGCKIKALRAKTSTYIKTPVRGEEPVFVVTGRKEDVAMARREIQSAAEHFTQIRATRNKAGVPNTVAPVPGLAHPMTVSSGNSSPTDLTSPGTITLQVRVPYRVVGLVVGPKGATIKRIQQQSHTYIVTPSRDKEPVFEVTGLPENVEKAKEEIEAHIAARTGSQHRDVDDDFASNGTVVGSPASFAARNQSAFTPYRNSPLMSQNRPDLGDASFRFPMQPIDNPFFSNYQIPGYSKFSQATNQQNTLMDMTQNGALNMYAQNTTSPIDQLDTHPDQITSNALGFDASAAPATSWALGDYNNGPLSFPIFSSASDASITQVPLNGAVLPSRLSPTFSDSDFPLALQPAQSVQSPMSNLSRPPMRRVGSDSVDSTGSSIHSLDFGNVLHKTVSNGINIESGYSSGSTTDSQTSGSPVENICGILGNMRTASPPRVCMMCHEGSVMAALVPCGHNLFCYECANNAALNSARCPCCNETATLALRIKTEPVA